MRKIFEQSIVDTHIHFWDLNKNSYDWIEDSSNINLKKNYLLDDFLLDIGELKVKKAIHIQAEINRSQSLKETRWLQSIADNNKFGFPHCIIGFVDLKNYNAEFELNQHADFGNFRGIRQILKYDSAYNKKEENLLQNDQWINNIKILEKKDLIFDLLINYFQFKEAAKILKKYPNIQFIINHTLWPINVDKENFIKWKNSIDTLSEFENVAIKLSGFGERDPFWNQKNIEPFFNYVLDKFSINRCMLGSNFPVDKAFSDKNYFDYWNSYNNIVTEFSNNEKDTLFFKNAEKFYKI